MPGSHHALLSLALALSLGTLFIVLSRRLGLPTIVLLLAGGVAAGPEGLGWIHPEALGPFLPVIVSLAVAIILFEGGLTLDLKGYSQDAVVIRRLLTVGVLITWAGASLAVKYFLQVDTAVALLSGSLVIVTGPTVIVPLLKRIRVQSRLHHILHWEGVLIDAIGVFIALLCFEWVTAHAGGQAVLNFAVRTASGLGIGLVGGWTISFALKQRLAPDTMVNGFALAMAVLLFAIAELIQSEAGLLAVTVAGLVVGSRRPLELHRIREFKGEITELLVGLLFMLLAARLELDQFRTFGPRGMLALGALIFIVRPLGILACTSGTTLNWREKIFLSWVAPRGIVAASMASLFVLALDATDLGFDPRIIETFTYSVIIATVVLQGFTAGLVAWALRLRRPEPTGWLVLGAHEFGRAVAKFLTTHTGTATVLMDRNRRHLEDAAAEGQCTVKGDALEPEELTGRPELVQAGQLIALTDNSDLNELACHRWSEFIRRQRLFRWSTDGSTRSHRLTHGQPVWNELPRPALIAGELVLHEAALEEVVIATPKPFPSGSTPLLIARERRVLVVGAGEHTHYRKGDRVLLLRRPGSYLARALAAGAMVELDTPDDLEVPFTALLDAAKARYPKLDVKAVTAQLTARARAFPFGIEHGIAVPNAAAPSLPTRICLLGRVTAARRLTFLVLSPHEAAEGHLGTLAEIARLCSRPEHRDALFDVTDHSAAVAFARDHAHTR